MIYYHLPIRSSTCVLLCSQLKLANQILAEDKHQPMYKVTVAGHCHRCYSVHACLKLT